ncbi:hypothetical protein [Thalassoglobus neptunius]|uniref:hypothetical protein n=1 Tax=Thalassoglobus neptunius TaxID=1938619 RepID=UPI0011B3C445|nr:hypothetical protein [Thalassoglobus neptunius]
MIVAKPSLLTEIMPEQPSEKTAFTVANTRSFCVMPHINDGHSNSIKSPSDSAAVASSSGNVTSSLEKKYQHWQFLWNSKQEVIDSLLDELETTMKLSQHVSNTPLRIIDTTSDHRHQS